MGPGTYNPLESKLDGKAVKNPLMSGFTFSKEKKYPKHQRSLSCLTGPGNYNINLEQSNQSKYHNTKCGGVILKSGMNTSRLSFDHREGPDPG